jgi:Fur family ferric uptake transcriptional regulator
MADPATPDLLEEVRERLEGFLAEGGHRKTPERFAVLEEIYAAGGHFDVDTLLDRMKQRGAKVSRATLYNTIELFLEAGLVRKHRFGEQSQYEPGYPARQHDHIILDSGEVLEFCDPRIQQIKATLEDHFGIEILHHALHIYARKKN